VTDLSSIQTIFDNDIARALTNFDNKLSSFITSLISDVNSVPLIPTTSTDVFDRVISAFSVGIGDSNTGIYGDFVADLTACVDVASQSINLYVSQISFPNQSYYDSLQVQISALSDHISQSTSSATKHVSDALSNANDKFSLALSSAQNKAAHFFIIAVTDSYIAAIALAESHLVDSINSLISIYNTYKVLPPGFYTDVNEILTEISTEYNDSLGDANSVYNESISSYKYYSTYSSDEISSSQDKVKIAIDSSSDRVSALFSSIPSMLYNKSDYVFSVVICKFSSQMFAESVRVRNQLENLISDLSKRSEPVFSNIEKQFKSGYSPIFVDGPDYRNSKSALLSQVSSSISDHINKMFADYNSRVSVLSSNYSTYLNDVQTSSIEYINNNVPGLTESQVSYINDKLSVAISRYVDRISLYFTYYSAYINHISDGLSRQFDKFVDRYYTNVPLLRFTGDIVTPPRISSFDYNLDDDGKVVASTNVFKIGVSNIGGSPWIGWLGVVLTSSVDYDTYAELYLKETGNVFTGDYDVPYFRWNKRIGFSFVSPGQSSVLSVQVPGTRIYNLSSLGGTVVPSVIVNTVYGGLKSLLH
jgi:hypothetical protein